MGQRQNFLNIGMAALGFIGVPGAGLVVGAIAAVSAIAGAIVVANDIHDFIHNDKIALGLSIGAMVGSALAAGGGIFKGGVGGARRKPLLGVIGLAIGGDVTYIGICQVVKNAQDKDRHIPPNEEQETLAARQSTNQSMNPSAAGSTSPSTLDGTQTVMFDPRNADHVIIKEAEVQELGHEAVIRRFQPRQTGQHPRQTGQHPRQTGQHPRQTGQVGVR
jgi:hypothetical protein